MSRKTPDEDVETTARRIARERDEDSPAEKAASVAATRVGGVKVVQGERARDGSETAEALKRAAENDGRV